MVRLPPNWVVIDGEPYYVLPSGPRAGYRRKGRWATCEICGERFPAQKASPGRYCSKRCAGRGLDSPAKKAKGRADLFGAWTAEEAWLAGLIWADGCLHEARRARGGRHILITSVDLELAEQAASIAGVSAHARTQAPPRKALYTVRIGQRAAVDALASLGLRPRKSLVNTFPELPRASERHFIRGFFDGNGTASLARNPSVKSPDWPARLISAFDGAERTLAGIQTVLEREAGIAPKKIQPHGRVRRIRFNHGDSLRLAEFMYAEGGPCLTRKREVFGEGAAQIPLRGR